MADIPTPPPTTPLFHKTPLPDVTPPPSLAAPAVSPGEIERAEARVKMLTIQTTTAKEAYLGSEDSKTKKLDKELYEQYLTKKRALQTAQAELVEVREKSEASSKA